MNLKLIMEFYAVLVGKISCHYCDTHDMEWSKNTCDLWALLESVCYLHPGKSKVCSDNNC